MSSSPNSLLFSHMSILGLLLVQKWQHCFSMPWIIGIAGFQFISGWIMIRLKFASTWQILHAVGGLMKNPTSTWSYVLIIKPLVRKAVKWLFFFLGGGVCFFIMIVLLPGNFPDINKYALVGAITIVRKENTATAADLSMRDDFQQIYQFSAPNLQYDNLSNSICLLFTQHFCPTWWRLYISLIFAQSFVSAIIKQ